ncbi:uncharacterized protein LOC110850139 [Folsomia candida]|uniref:Death domain-containing protein n=1 Tax=Folsomia candida TaxID=158441 RepID=A0A226EAB5_FOLCA|nr:uncharacterized protein LOC110850139 [Folsomia candida]OXA54350.1 hypothetical protein Fcan01_11559 [Folsomia candida]
MHQGISTFPVLPLFIKISANMFPTRDVAGRLIRDKKLTENLSGFATALISDNSWSEELQINENDKLNFIKEILQKWVSKNGIAATLTKLVELLLLAKLDSAAGIIQQGFGMYDKQLGPNPPFT